MDVRKEFETYIRETNRDGSNKAGSYLLALESVNKIARAGLLPQFDFQNIYDLADPALLQRLHRFLLDEGQTPGNPMLAAIPDATSHLLGRFSAAAIGQLTAFLKAEVAEEEILERCRAEKSARTAAKIVASAPAASRMFRKLVLDDYRNACCLTGLAVSETLHACIIDPPGNGREATPDNALCLSATYADAFNAHLITLDENLRMVLSPSLKAATTGAVFNNVFRTYEGTRIRTPQRFPPREKFLAAHRELLAG